MSLRDSHCVQNVLPSKDSGMSSGITSWIFFGVVSIFGFWRVPTRRFKSSRGVSSGKFRPAVQVFWLVLMDFMNSSERCRVFAWQLKAKTVKAIIGTVFILWDSFDFVFSKMRYI